MVHVPYKGAGPAITDLIGGRLDFMVTTLPSIVGFIKSGKAKPLAVTMQARTKQLPDVPTIAESGFPDYQAAAWYGFAVPKGTPPEIVTKLRDATVAATKTDSVKRSLDIEGAEPVGNTPEEFAALHAERVEALGRADPDDRAHHGLSCADDAGTSPMGAARLREASDVERALEKPRDVVGGLVVVGIGGVPAVRPRAGDGHLVPDGAGLLPDHPQLADDRPGGGDGRAGLAGAAPGGRVRRRCRGGRWCWSSAPCCSSGSPCAGSGLAPVLVVVVLATAWASRYASLKASVPLALGHRPVLLAACSSAGWACPCR